MNVKAMRVKDLEAGNGVKIHWEGLFRYLDQKHPSHDRFYVVLMLSGFAHPIILDEDDVVLVLDEGAATLAD